MKNIEINSFLDYKFISNLDSSPNLKKSVFTMTTSNIDENKYNSNIFLMDNESQSNRQITYLDSEQNLLWLDNDTILFKSERNKKLLEKIKQGEEWTEFYALNINGGEGYRYITLPVLVSDIKLIDKNLFLLIATKDISSDNKEKNEKEEKEYEILDEIPFFYNGKGITNKKRSALYLYNREKDELTALTDKYMDVESFEYKNDKVVYIGKEFKDKMGLTNGLFTYDLSLKKTETIIKDGLYSFSYVNFIKDKIICAATDMKEFGINENVGFYIAEENNLSLISKKDISIGSSVGSDCRYGGGHSIRIKDETLYYIETIDDSSVISSLSINGEEKTITKPSGSVDFFDLSSDGISFVGMKDHRLQELYSLVNGEENKLSSFNDEVLSNYKITSPEKFNFESNGDTLEGFIIKPAHYEEGKTYPAILDIHGGPKTVYGNTFFHEMQVWSNKGYFVFFTNPHGSDGKGNKFSDIRGKYGEIDYEDLLNFTDIVTLKYPNIDKENIGVTGGSYGGFMTNWIIGHTDRFKCAASQRSISNWVSKFGSSDIGYYFNADQMLANPWENLEKIWYHSPLKYANQAKTPTLFIHSEEDYRCPLSEGIQMFSALKYHGVDSRICIFKKENHELSRSGRPKNRIKRLEEITNWFEKYLKP